MDLPFEIKVIIGEYYLWKCDVYSDMCGPKCRRKFSVHFLRYAHIIMGLHPQCTRQFQKQPP